MSLVGSPRVLPDTASTACFQRREPTDDLRPYVAFYWQSQPTTEVHSCALPNATGLLSFNLGPQSWYSAPAYGQVQAFASSQVFGHLTHPRWCRYPAGTVLFGVTLQPGALALLLGCAAHELANWATNAAGEPCFAALEEALLRPATFAARVALAERYLRALFQRRAPDYRFPLVQAAIACLTPHSSAPAAVTQVAEHLNVSPKSLTRHFQHLVGVGPKRCAQLIRFKAALTAYRQSAPSFDAEAAGYADFTHFARASHRLVGRSLAEL
ncbi:hypothetical protein GCM10023172_43190 [Hymenobacter ginsengisoli]|uniref:HTH araC/xylS-type domain-containing protein n=1 Tax=Hymenobacter ginsengisoli TaxID=1051626 RepID=A0ABP8QV12_9BACT